MVFVQNCEKIDMNSELMSVYKQIYQIYFVFLPMTPSNALVVTAFGIQKCTYWKSILPIECIIIFDISNRL